MSSSRLLLVVCCAFMLALTAPASAVHDSNFKDQMDLVFQSPNATGAVNSDLAFWGDRAYAGNYDGFRIFDISNPDSPRLVTDFRCFGPQNDLTVWDRDGDGRADLLIASVDRTLTGPACGATATGHDDPAGTGKGADQRRYDHQQKDSDPENRPFHPRLVEEAAPLSTSEHRNGIWAAARVAARALAPKAPGGLAISPPS